MGNSGDSDKSGPYREAVTTRVTPQNYERYERYTEQESLSKSEALRQLIRSGLDRELDDNENEQEQTSSGDTGTGLLILGTILGVGVLGGYLSGGGNPDQWVPWLVVGLLATGAYLKYQP
jgi:hypothetical protein